MSFLKLLLFVTFLTFTFSPAHASDKSYCELEKFQRCFVNYTKDIHFQAEECAKAAVEACSKSTDIYGGSIGNLATCRALDEQTFFSEGDSSAWQVYNCCPQVKTSDCYSRQQAGLTAGSKDVPPLVSCARQAQTECVGHYERSKTFLSAAWLWFALWSVVSILFFIFAIKNFASQAEAKKAQRERSLNLRDKLLNELKPDEFFFSEYDQSFIALSNKDSLLHVGRGAFQRTYAFTAIGKAEVLQDGSVLNSVNKGSQVAGVIVGGALLGAGGALIGGLSGSSSSKKMIERLTLRIMVDDTANPFWDVEFFKGNVKGGVSPDNYALAPAIRSLDRFNALLFNIIKRNT